MKFSKYLFILIISFLLVACSKDSSDPKDSDPKNESVLAGEFKALFTYKEGGKISDQVEASGSAHFGMTTNLDNIIRTPNDSTAFVIYLKYTPEDSKKKPFIIQFSNLENERIVEGTYAPLNQQDYRIFYSVEFESINKGYRTGFKKGGMTFTVTKSTPDLIEGTFKLNHADTDVFTDIDYTITGEGSFVAKKNENIDKVME